VPTLLHPTAHDEPPMRLSIFQEVMRAPDAFVFLTPEEADLVRARFPGAPSGDVVGIGVEMDRPGDADAFRRTYGLGDTPYLLYVGRVDPAKGAAELLDYFVAYKERNPGDLKLARKRLRNNAFRLGIEWSRIFPTSTAAVDISGGITLPVLQQLDLLADQAEVLHYRAVLAAIRAQGLEPFVTLVHFTLPLWIHDPIATRAARM